MGTAEALLERLETLGITAEAEGENLVVIPASKVPTEMVEELRQHKADILVCLKRECTSLERSYRQVYPGAGPASRELSDIEGRVAKEGYVLCRSHVLGDFVAFHREDIDPSTIPPGFVPYSLSELNHLFQDGPPSVNCLRLVHEAKKVGGAVVDSYPDEAT